MRYHIKELNSIFGTRMFLHSKVRINKYIAKITVNALYTETSTNLEFFSLCNLNKSSGSFIVLQRRFS